jgi:hypothetical protein
MSIVDMLVEGDEFRRDGGYNLPSEWRFLARAEAGDPEAVETVARHTAGSDDESALRMAADRLKSPTDWRAANALAVADDSHLGQWRTAFLGRSEGRTKRVALMDSTTLYTAVKLVDGDDVGLATPLTVLDLVTFLNTLCLYDRICFLRNPAVALHDLESRFGPELFVELPVEQAHLQAAGHGTLGDMREDLRGLYRWRTVPWINDVRQGRLGTKAQRQVWVDTLETILEGECDPDWLLRDPDEGGHDLFSDLWNTPAKLLFYDIVGHDRRAPRCGSRDRLAGPRSQGACRAGEQRPRVLQCQPCPSS